MKITADTSFLYALYRRQDNSERALRCLDLIGQPVLGTPLLVWEFRQSVRFQAFRHRMNPEQGFPLSEAEAMIAKLRQHVELGILQIVRLDLLETLALAERVSKARTYAGGHRSFDVLHVSAALAMDADSFLSFDGNQNKLAAAEGLATPLAEEA